MARTVPAARIRLAHAQARKLLDECAITSAPVNVKKIARHTGARLAYEAFPAKDGISGVLLRKKTGAVIVINDDDYDVRQRFSIAHEIGHLVLHDDDVHIDYRDARAATGAEPREVEANAFAAELLMPSALLRTEGTVRAGDDDVIQKLAKKYDVSAAAMSWRLTNLGLLQ